jgi:CBS domain-containing protein
MRVSEIMNPKLLYIQEGDRLTLARAKILEFGVTAVPVLDEAHRPVGVVSLRDLARGDEHITATVPAIVVREDAPIEEGALALATGSVHHLVVVDGEGAAVGMVSAVDFVRAFLGLPSIHPEPFAHY